MVLFYELCEWDVGFLVPFSELCERDVGLII